MRLMCGHIFPEMHQISPAAISDFKNFPGGETIGPLLTGMGMDYRVPTCKGRAGRERTKEGERNGKGKEGGGKGPAAGGSCSNVLGG